MTAATEPATMRVTNIALDFDELPREITVIMSAPVAERISKEFACVPWRPFSPWRPFVAGEPETLSIDTAALIARRFGKMTPTDDAVHEVWDCLTGVVFNRFWGGGLDHYEAGRP